MARSGIRSQDTQLHCSVLYRQLNTHSVFKCPSLANLCFILLEYLLSTSHKEFLHLLNSFLLIG